MNIQNCTCFFLFYYSEGKGYIQIESDKGIPDRVNILKSDGTTLYITR